MEDQNSIPVSYKLWLPRGYGYLVNMNHTDWVVTCRWGSGLETGNLCQLWWVNKPLTQEELLQSQLGFQRVNNSLRLRCPVGPGRKDVEKSVMKHEDEDGLKVERQGQF